MPLQMKDNTLLLEKQAKKDKSKIKKYESILKHCLSIIAELTSLLQEVNDLKVPEKQGGTKEEEMLNY